MTMLLYVPTLVLDGVPYNLPVVALKAAHLGLLLMLNRSVSRSASAAVGRNEYERPTVAVLGGVPEIVGARLAIASVDASGATASCADPIAGASTSRAVQRNL
jgi:hypothetical protein